MVVVVVVVVVVVYVQLLPEAHARHSLPRSRRQPALCSASPDSLPPLVPRLLSHNTPPLVDRLPQQYLLLVVVVTSDEHVIVVITVVLSLESI